MVVAQLEHALAAREEVALLLVGRARLVTEARRVAQEVVCKVRSVRLAEALPSAMPQSRGRAHLHAEDLLVELASASALRGWCYLQRSLGVPDTEPVVS